MMICAMIKAATKPLKVGLILQPDSEQKGHQAPDVNGLPLMLSLLSNCPQCERWASGLLAQLG